MAERSISLSDETLMVEMKKGSLRAFERIIQRWDERMFTFFLRNVGDAHEAEDLRQELFLRLYQKRGTYRPMGNFKSWLYRIATNLAIDRYKRIKRTAGREFDELEDGATGLDGSNSPFPASDRASMNEMNERIELALSRISDDKRIVVVMHHFENLRCAEIADALRISLPTVKYRLYSGLNELRVELKRLGVMESTCFQSA